MSQKHHVLAVRRSAASFRRAPTKAHSLVGFEVIREKIVGKWRVGRADIVQSSRPVGVVASLAQGERASFNLHPPTVERFDRDGVKISEGQGRRHNGGIVVEKWCPYFFLA